MNEKVDSLNEDARQLTGESESVVACVCECGELSCTDQIRVEKAAYERVRSNPVWFLVKQGHEIPDVEHVVDTAEGYLIVEKDPPEARAFARETAP